jgi:hypothetical protein
LSLEAQALLEHSCRPGDRLWPSRLVGDNEGMRIRLLQVLCMLGLLCLASPPRGAEQVPVGEQNGQEQAPQSRLANATQPAAGLAGMPQP